MGVTVLMPRFLDYNRNRFPSFGRYVVIHRRVHTREFIHFAGEEKLSFWVDPESREVGGDLLGLAFHTWIGKDENTITLA